MAKLSYETVAKMLRIQKYKQIAEYDKVVDIGIETMWKNLCDQVTDPNDDPTDIFDEELENLKNTSYAMKLMNICCLSETWEQDLYNFLKEKGLIEVFSNDYGATKRAFEQAYPTCAISNHPLINEMRALVNAIKHGEGNAFQNIRRITSDTILADSNLGVVTESGETIKKKQIEFDSNTLTSRTLNVDGKLQFYSDALVRFWEDVYQADAVSTEEPESL